MRLLRMLSDLTGSAKAKMAATKQDIFRQVSNEVPTATSMFQESSIQLGLTTVL